MASVLEGEKLTVYDILDKYDATLMVEVYRIIEDYLSTRRASTAVFSKHTLRELIPLYGNSKLAFFVKQLSESEVDNLLHLLILILAIALYDTGITIRDTRGREWRFEHLQRNARLVFSRV